VSTGASLYLPVVWVSIIFLEKDQLGCTLQKNLILENQDSKLIFSPCTIASRIATATAPATMTTQITRVTMIKLPSEDHIDIALKGFGIFAKSQKKVGRLQSTMKIMLQCG
jgi:hypothetical protein